MIHRLKVVVLTAFVALAGCALWHQEPVCPATNPRCAEYEYPPQFSHRPDAGSEGG